ncbi:HAMP domain-containing histidine kinase [Cellulophaga sp. HaHaR_3_176]|uniref:sensor histidine kinase n=1 Tax=Cellulophaga sp. HaHaR_3_176 TaxID=1942464 RepID=UPI001C1FF35F|nr:HAMP domain-containing sensor histidine kinase [Cellulophaga sp. HaHaR_3_176]QWX84921.1 HAMP domain-containing histidine kinase [Cellulophaga sp. HaHaR_3_176]
MALNAFALLLLLIVATIIIYKKNKTITGLKALLQEKKIALKRIEEKAENDKKTQDKIFSIISHDLKSPINGLKSLLLLLKNGDIDSNDFLRFTPKLYNDVDAMSFSLSNLLSWSKSQMKGFIHVPVNFNLREEIQETITSLKENITKKNISVENLAPDSIVINCDKNQFKIIIRNLLHNAIKFTNSKGKITINIIEDNDFYKVTITDNGVGMTDDIKNKIFSSDKKYITTYGTANEKGTGIGLKLCKQMIEHNKGTLSAETILGEGSTFYFTIPKN